MMKSFLREYVRSYKFGHPCTEDILETLERVTGEQWDEFFDKYVYGTGE